MTREEAGREALAANGFAFQTGEWAVRHRKLRERLAGSSEWETFEGTCRARELLGGAANIEEHMIGDPGGAYGAIGLRAVDPGTGLWSIWWLDGRRKDIDPPVRGRFVDGVGVFTCSDELAGRPIDVRFTWSDITSGSARWEQAFAPEGSGDWEVNWTMEFERCT